MKDQISDEVRMLSLECILTSTLFLSFSYAVFFTIVW